MFLKAGAISLVLLLASRLLGLARESAQAAAFGASGLADLAILMLALPDWFAGLLASGALAYVLVPAWAGQTRATVQSSQRRLGLWLAGCGILLGALLVLNRRPAVLWLAGGLPPGLQPVAADALVWSAAALPAALLASLWATRLQHERDFTGLYAANLVVNVSLIAAIAAMAGAASPSSAMAGLGAGLLAAMGLRLVWLAWRQRARAPASPTQGVPMALASPPVPVWLWAVLVAGLPLALPFAGRSMASQGGEGALATFNYAWKLVELPLLLAVQLVATLAFPAVAAALAGRDAPHEESAARPIRSAFALSWTLACVAAAALVAGAPALARLLFGWGRMDEAALDAMSRWAAAGAWGLLPQALAAVALTVLAAQGRLGAVAVAYAVALALLLACGAWGLSDGWAVMHLLNLLFLGVAAVALAAMGPAVRSLLAVRALVLPLACLLAVAAARWLWPAGPAAGMAWGLAAAAAAAAFVASVSWLGSADLRGSLRR